MNYCGIIKKEDIENKVSEMKEKEFWKYLIPENDGLPATYKIVNVVDNQIPPAVHTRDLDIYYIVDGKAEFTFKGTLVNPHKMENDIDNETIRGDLIENGKTVSVKEGDLIIIPKGTPHSMNAKKSSIRFLTIKIKPK